MIHNPRLNLFCRNIDRNYRLCRVLLMLSLLQFHPIHVQKFLHRRKFTILQTIPQASKSPTTKLLRPLNQRLLLSKISERSFPMMVTPTVSRTPRGWCFGFSWAESSFKKWRIGPTAPTRLRFDGPSAARRNGRWIQHPHLCRLPRDPAHCPAKDVCL